MNDKNDEILSDKTANKINAKSQSKPKPKLTQEVIDAFHENIKTICLHEVHFNQTMLVDSLMKANFDDFSFEKSVGSDELLEYVNDQESYDNLL